MCSLLNTRTFCGSVTAKRLITLGPLFKILQMILSPFPSPLCRLLPSPCPAPSSHSGHLLPMSIQAQPEGSKAPSILGWLPTPLPPSLLEAAVPLPHLLPSTNGSCPSSPPTLRTSPGKHSFPAQASIGSAYALSGEALWAWLDPLKVRRASRAGTRSC